MKLFYSITSPYVRKVMACAIARGIDGHIDRVPTSTSNDPPDLIAANPLCRVPCLVTDDGLPLFDSPVICEFLDTIGDAPPLFPAAGASRWRALKLQALGDGIMDAAVPRRQEQARPKEDARDRVMARHQAAVARALAALEADLPGRSVDIGALAVACALGYLDFRFAHEPWRDAHPKLAAWFAGMAETPAIAGTVPKDPA